MAVYERRYRGYEGYHVPDWTLFSVLPRYAASEVFRSRFFTGFYFLCFVGPLLSILFIYIRHNAGLLETMPQLGDWFTIGPNLTYYYLELQAMFLGFMVTLVVGPALVSADLRNGGLPLYLCRPLTRVEYVLGKLSVLVVLLSLITWVPGMLLYFLEGYLQGDGWLLKNVRLLVTVVLGSWLWIAVLSLLALALSAWIKHKSLASGLLAGVVLVGLGLANIIDVVVGTRWAQLLSIKSLTESVWWSLLGAPDSSYVPAGVALVALAGVVLASLGLLWRKVTAFEVSKR